MHFAGGMRHIAPTWPWPRLRRPTHTSFRNRVPNRASVSARVLRPCARATRTKQFFQQGAARAEYGDQLLEVLSSRLQTRVGRGYSVTNLKYFRLFYQAYADREPKIRHEARDVLDVLAKATRPAGRLQGFSSRLSWTHYRTLTKVDHPAERAFYEIEAELDNWSVPQLERQIDTRLFARLLKSRDKPA